MPLCSSAPINCSSAAISNVTTLPPAIYFLTVSSLHPTVQSSSKREKKFICKIHNSSWLTEVTILVIFLAGPNTWRRSKSYFVPLLTDSAEVIVIPNVSVLLLCHYTCWILRFLSFLTLLAFSFARSGTTYVPMIFAFVGTILVLVID